MSLAIANARDQYVFLRNFTTRKWENLAGGGKTCRVQVLKKSNGDHTLKIFPDGGQVIELKLSKENHIHFTGGFIQVPVADSKKLYGIKFQDNVLGDEFYTKLIKAIGVPRSYPRTTIGADGNPDPVGEKPAAKQVPQSLPQSTNKRAPAREPKATPPQPQPSIFTAPSPQVPKYVPSQATPQTWPAEATPPVVKEVKPTVQQQSFVNQQSPSSGPQGQYAQQKLHYPSPQKQPAAVHSPHPHQLNQVQQGGADRENLDSKATPRQLGHQMTDKSLFTSSSQSTGPPRNQPTFVSPQSPPQDSTFLGRKQPMYQNVPLAEPPDYYNKARAYNSPVQAGFSQQSNQSSVVQPKKQLKPEPPSTAIRINMQDLGTSSTVDGNSVKTKDYYDGPNTTVQTSTQGSGQASSIARQPTLQSQLSSASPRLQRLHSSQQPSDMKSVAEAMSDAMNRLDDEKARRMFDTLMNLMKTSENAGKCEMNFYAEPEPSKSTFTLNIQVEFQKPNKEPIPIFLDDVSPDNTINVLSERVEHYFYIPKLSQNWIIGSRLVKGTDMNKTLKDFGVRGDGVGEVGVFMYVMHTKKAQVPHEAARVHQQQHRQQQQQGLEQIQQQSQSTDRPPAPRPAWYDPSGT